jgi:site-specific DNA-methyltransferase (adenine-specific)
MTCSRKIGPFDCCSVVHGDCRETPILLGYGDVVIADPPYQQTSLAWDRWQDGWLSRMGGSALWCFGSLRMLGEHWREFIEAGWHLSQDIVWEKQNGSNFHNDRFRRVHEQIAHFYRGNWDGVRHDVPVTNDATARTVRRKERPPHMGEIEASTYTSVDGGPRLRRSVIQEPNCHGFADHPTQKPVGIIAPLIEYSTNFGNLVVDPFCGSGTAVVVAKQLGRHFLGFEISEQYCEIARRRLAEVEAQPLLFSAAPEQMTL